MKKIHFLLGILLILGFINSTRVNMKYPTYINETYNLDDVFKLNGLSYQITECKLYEHEEFAEKYAIVQSKENQVNIVLRMSVINNTQTLQYIPLEQFILESIGWYSNFNLKYFQNINNISDYFVSIESNEKKNCYCRIVITIYMKIRQILQNYQI